MKKTSQKAYVQLISGKSNRFVPVPIQIHICDGNISFIELIVILIIVYIDDRKIVSLHLERDNGATDKIS